MESRSSRRAARSRAAGKNGPSQCEQWAQVLGAGGRAAKASFVRQVLALLNAYLLPSPGGVPCSMFLLFSPLYPYTLSTLIASPRFVPSPSSSSTDFSTVAHSLAWQMLSAVAYLHQELIAHRDLSPANFVLSHEGRAVLIDFGISIQPGDEEPGAMHCEVGTG